MEILFSSIHTIDIDGGTIKLREKENEFEDALALYLARINSENNLRKYGERPDDTIVVEKVMELCEILSTGLMSDELFSEKNAVIADKLLSVELEIEEQLKKLKTRVQRGSLLQAIVHREKLDEYEYYIAKLEHSEFFTEESFSRMLGYPSDKSKVYKSCRFKIKLINGEILLDCGEVYVNHEAKYWTDKFLELDEINSDQMNTKKAFNAIDGLLAKMIKPKYKVDYLTLRNYFIGYFKTSVRHIDYFDMIDNVIDNYSADTVPEKIMKNFKEELNKLPDGNDFDTQFTIDPTAVRKRIRTIHKVSEGIELVLNKDGKIEDFEKAIFSVVEDGVRYIKIVVDEAETFKYFDRQKNNI